MKVAVLGSGPLAIEVAVDLVGEGASVKLIGKNDPGGHLSYLSKVLPKTLVDFQSSTTEVGRELSGFSTEALVSVAELTSEYYAPLVRKLEETRSIQQREVLRVQKQFLELDEEIDSHSRLFDLFRVTTALNPSGMVEEQLEQNPELREKIGEEILSSLKNQVESFEDFDLVIDARGSFQVPLALGPSGFYALNESVLSSNSQVHYGLMSPKTISDLEKFESITIVGTGYNAALNLCLLENWLGEKEGRVVNIVGPEKAAFKKVLKDKNTPEIIKEGVKRIIKTHLSLWRSKCEEVEKEILNWRGLEAHERMKVTPPEFPTPKVCLYEGYSVTSVDRLLDQDATFLTLEIPNWRNENEAKNLVTLAQDLVLGSNGFRESSEVIGPMRNDEPGFFKLSANDGLATGLENIKLIKSAIFNFFSRAE
jgi:hypothetical protein